MNELERVFNKKEKRLQFLIFSLFFLFSIIYFQAWQNWQSLLTFSFAYFLGFFLLLLDEKYLYSFYIEKTYISDKNISHENTKNPAASRDTNSIQLLTRHPLFIISLFLMGVFVLTSTGSVAGMALVISLNLFLFLEILQLRKEPLLFVQRFFASSKLLLSRKEIRLICLFQGVCFLILLLLYLI